MRFKVLAGLEPPNLAQGLQVQTLKPEMKRAELLTQLDPGIE
jgi:hypothetical protein